MLHSVILSTDRSVARPWVVMLHAAAMDHRSHLPLAQLLSPRFHVLLVDLPGHGQSPRPPALTLQHCAQALKQTLDELGIAKAAVVGFSFGGVVAQVFARSHPNRVSALVLYSSYLPYLVALPQRTVLLTRLWLSLSSWSSIKRSFARICANSPEGVQVVEQALDGFDKQRFKAVVQALHSQPAVEAEFRFQAPMMYIIGSKDRTAGDPRLSLVERVRETYREAVVVQVPEAGHCAHLDNAHAFNAAVESFLINTVVGKPLAPPPSGAAARLD